MSIDRKNAAMLPAMRLEHTERAGRSFVDAWAEKIYPRIKNDYASMVGKSPTRRTARKQLKAESEEERQQGEEGESCIGCQG